MSSENFDACLTQVLRYEGGYVNNPRDPGGPTNMGVTLATLAHERGKAVTASDVHALTRSEAGSIYRKKFWNVVRGDELPAGVDLLVFDSAVNSGPGRAAQWLAKSLGMAVQTMITPALVNAAHAKDPRELVRAYCATRLAFLRSLSTFSTFGHGWTSRVDDLQGKAIAMAAHGGSPYGGSPLGLLSTGESDAVPEGKVRAAQAQLQAKGYFPGAIDGDHGSATTGALASLQRDQGLPVTGTLDPATEDALWSATDRPISEDRASATADDLREAGSETVAAADTVVRGGNHAVLGAGGVAFGTAAELGSSALSHGRDVLDKVNDAKDTASGFGDVLAGLSDKLPWLASHWGLILAFIAAGFIAFEIYRLVHGGARRVIRERVKKHRAAADLSR